MKIYLLQHGEAVLKEQDPDRPLTTQGKQCLQRLAEFFKNAGVNVDHILHSGKTRAMQSAELLAAYMLQTGHIQFIEGLSPNDSVSAFAENIDNWSGDTLLVGHMPFMQKLASYMLTGDEDSVPVAFLPGGVVVLEKNENDAWALCAMIRPELLVLSR